MKGAWVTLATNDSYSLGALVLAHSLKQVATTKELAVLVTPGVTNSMRGRLSQVFNLVQEVNVLDSRDQTNLRLLQRPELGITFTKLHCWRLTQYEKCVFLDADTLVLQNCDELFEREELSAAPDVGWPDCFNSGVFVYKPSVDTYDKLIQFALEKGSFDGGDQGLLNLYFSDWAHKDISKHLPFIYNVCSTAFYSYLPAFKQFGQNVKIIHFIGNAKPWIQYFDTETKKVRPSGDIGHLTAILQKWWDIFCLLVHPDLTADMSGLAGAFSKLTLGQQRSPEQEALENSLRRQNWEQGNVDYLGRDSFDNIWSKICETLAKGPQQQEPTPKEPKEVAKSDELRPVVQEQEQQIRERATTKEEEITAKPVESQQEVSTAPQTEEIRSFPEKPEFPLSLPSAPETQPTPLPPPSAPEKPIDCPLEKPKTDSPLTEVSDAPAGSLSPPKVPPTDSVADTSCSKIDSSLQSEQPKSNQEISVPQQQTQTADNVAIDAPPPPSSKPKEVHSPEVEQKISQETSVPQQKPQTSDNATIDSPSPSAEEAEEVRPSEVKQTISQESSFPKQQVRTADNVATTVAPSPAKSDEACLSDVERKMSQETSPLPSFQKTPQAVVQPVETQKLPPLEASSLISDIPASSEQSESLSAPEKEPAKQSSDPQVASDVSQPELPSTPQRESAETQSSPAPVSSKSLASETKATVIASEPLSKIPDEKKPTSSSDIPKAPSQTQTTPTVVTTESSQETQIDVCPVVPPPRKGSGNKKQGKSKK